MACITGPEAEAVDFWGQVCRQNMTSRHIPTHAVLIETENTSDAS